jgi:hypothetical protein
MVFSGRGSLVGLASFALPDASAPVEAAPLAPLARSCGNAC